jgi:hypothetical protein
MTDEQIANALRKHMNNEKLDPAVSKFLYTHGFAEGSTSHTNFQSTETEYLLTFITNKGQALLDRHKE